MDPVDIKNVFVDRVLRLDVSAMPPNGANARVGFKDFESCLHKLRNEDRIAVKEEDVSRARLLPPRVPGWCGGLDPSMKNDELGIEVAGPWTSLG
jgi:hypothetical protein